VAKKKPPVRQLVNHRDVAKMFGTSPSNWRRWVNSGVVPLPHQSIATLLLYDRAVIDHRLETGLWPAGVQFLPGSRADQLTRRSDDEHAGES
jgi:hypothetical protein